MSIKLRFLVMYRSKEFVERCFIRIYVIMDSDEICSEVPRTLPIYSEYKAYMN